jgi:hypothetical protein
MLQQQGMTNTLSVGAKKPCEKECMILDINANLEYADGSTVPTNSTGVRSTYLSQNNTFLIVNRLGYIILSFSMSASMSRMPPAEGFQRTSSNPATKDPMFHTTLPSPESSLVTMFVTMISSSLILNL